ncbi:MAG TPA: RHS repeat-associated core domain-containing protein [Caldimonas sp.]|jgi:RHS repeat-associated protein
MSLRSSPVIARSDRALAAAVARGVGGTLLLLTAFFAAAQIAPTPTGQTRSGAAAPGITPAPLGSGTGDAPTPKTYFEQGILVRSGEVIEALGPNLMGDSINEYSGALEFTQTDVSLPGNNALPVAVGRHRAVGAPQTNGGGLFGDWDLEIPHLHAVATQAEPNWYGAATTTNFNRCSQFYYPPWTYAYVAGGNLSYDYRAFWDGAHLYVPGVGDQTLFSRFPEYVGQGPANPIYPSDGTPSTYPVLTKNHWELKCLPLENGPGEGFEARSLDGTRYRFDHIAVRSWPIAKVAGINRGIAGSGTIPRVEIWILPTSITDRFGNWVRYTYTGTDGWRVATITSSDGRTITFGYSGNGNRIQTVFDGTRTWTYGYNGSTGSLQTVTQPDGSQWQFAMDSVPWQPFALPDPDCDGGENGTVDQTEKTLTITHPSGAVGSFTLKATYHGRSNVPGSQVTCGTTSNPVSRYFISRSLSTKTLSGPGMPAMTWSYAYSLAYGSFAPCNGCVRTKTVTITDPLSNVAVKTFGTQYGLDEGLPVASTEGPGSGGALRSTSYVYAASDAGPFPSRVGYVNAPADSMSRIYRPQSQRVIAQQGVTFNNTATGFDLYARATGSTSSSDLGFSRTELIGYYDHTSLWILGQVASRTVSGIQASSTTFNTGTALPTATYKFGKLQANYFFASDGTLYQVVDPLNHPTTYSNYMRGLPRNITYADGKGISATINNIGTIASVTNEVGPTSTWNYGYDAMGRLASATPPGGYSTKWLTFAQIHTPEYGLEADHWRQTITEGSATTLNYFDARWRKRLTLTYDANNPAATQRMQSFAYDPYNRTTFASYPARSIGSIADTVPGTTTAYEPLGRAGLIVADSELGPLTTRFAYLDHFQTRVTNPRGFLTTTSYQVFDEPDESSILSIVAPEGLTVNFSRDLFGTPLSVTRSGAYAGTPVSATRSYVYDANHLLCKTVEPEVGATIQQLDAANNVSWRATGQSFTSLSTCDAASVRGTKIVAYTYDARNRLTGTGFGDRSPSIGRAYTDDGLPASIVSNGSTWLYSYDAARLLRQESLTFGSTYTVGWAYSGNRHLNQITYPDGAVVAYNANALGEATQVGGYAAGVSYHPNGAVAGYTLGNGIVHTVSQNTRGLALVNRDAGVLQDQYSYDADGNITAIADLQEGINGRSMAYDGLDRLTAANAPGVWGSASYGYDPLGNLRTSAVGSRSSIHNYDANNLLSVLNTNGVRTRYAYDAQGNVTKRGNASFDFDIGNRMSLAEGVATYAYDGLGRRTAISSADGTYQVQVYSQAGQLLYGTRQNGMTLTSTRYVYLGSKAIAETSSVSGTTYLHTDGLGSPVAVTSATGALASRTRYEPYGATAAGTVPTELGFTGHVNDPSTGLVYMQQRYYDSLAARFLSVDPIVTDANNGEAFNRFAYVNNNPYRSIDPDGQGETICEGMGCKDVMEQLANAKKQNRLAWERAVAAGDLDGMQDAADEYAEMPGAQPMKNAGRASVLLRGLSDAGRSRDGGHALAIGALAGFQIGMSGFAEEGAGKTTTVIGRLKDLEKLGPGEKSLLDRLPYVGNGKANWEQNARVLRVEMRLGRPIRDASPGDTGQFLNAERNLLRDHGWTFNAQTSFWMPPKP